MNSITEMTQNKKIATSIAFEARHGFKESFRFKTYSGLTRDGYTRSAGIPDKNI